MPKSISPETQAEARQIAKATQRPGQTKEQTKAIAQGIEKGIAEFKKKEKAKARERDKQRRKEQRQPATAEPTDSVSEPLHPNSKVAVVIPWVLLLVSWLLFGVYLFWAR